MPNRSEERRVGKECIIYMRAVSGRGSYMRYICTEYILY